MFFLHISILFYRFFILFYRFYFTDFNFILQILFYMLLYRFYFLLYRFDITDLFLILFFILKIITDIELYCSEYSATTTTKSEKNQSYLPVLIFSWLKASLQLKMV